MYADHPDRQRTLQFKDVKGYFLKKTKNILSTVEENGKTVQKKQEDQQKSYEKYYELKTKGKTF